MNGQNTDKISTAIERSDKELSHFRQKPVKYMKFADFLFPHLGLPVAGFAVGWWALVGISAATAQIVPDNTLPQNSRVTNQNHTLTINGGTQAGSNLFHSFQEFSIPTGSSARFNNATSIQNIITRVTGDRLSTIDGVLAANGTANLFLLNPNGIVFGENARLDIDGSFVASTANSIQFADGRQFTTQNQPAPLLSVNVPVGLQVGQNPGTIQVRGPGHQLSVAVPQFAPIIRPPEATGLQVPPGKTLALIGGDIDLVGGILTVNPGNVVLGAVEQATVRIDSNNFTFQFPNPQNSATASFRDITLRSQALVDASTSLPGAQETMPLLPRNPSNFPTAEMPANTATTSSIYMQGRNVNLKQGALALIQNIGFTEAGDIQVVAAQNLDVKGITSAANISTGLLNETLALGNGGDIAVAADRVRVQKGGAIHTRTFGPAAAGNITIQTSDRLEVTGFSPRNPAFISNITTSSLNEGFSGNIEITTERLLARDGGVISSSTAGTGDGGNVQVTAHQSVEVTGVEPFRFVPSAISAATLSAGHAGSVRIDTEVLQVDQGGRVDSSTVASGAAGSVLVNASDRIEVQGTVPGSVNPSIIISSANLVDPSLQESFGLSPVPSGAAGNVTLNTPFLAIRDGALVNVRNDGTGDAGQLQVTADSIRLGDGGGMTAATAAGNGGNIILQTQRLQLSENSEISAAAGGVGNGGNLAIATELLALLDDSQIAANAFEGLGGNIQINAQGLFLSKNSTITASSQLGVDGLVNISEPEINPSAGLLNVETKIDKQPPVVASSCDRTASSEFVISGRENLPPTPAELANNQASTWLDWRLRDEGTLELADSSDMLKPATATKSQTIVEATGWMKKENGVVTLVAPSQSNGNMQRPTLRSNCSS
jgi:filamentous hemagglutinin family protein